MPSDSKPVILMVPGAWQPANSFDTLRQHLAQRGYQSVAIDHPSVGSEPADQTLGTDVENLRRTLHQLCDEEFEEVILVLHSYGGVVGSCASEGFTLKQRANEGKKGGIVDIIYLAAFTLQSGQCLLNKLGNQMPPWMKLEGSKVYVDTTPEMAFPDLPKHEQDKWHSNLTHTAAGVFSSNATYEPWHEISCTYIIFDNDTILPPPIQEAMAHSIGATIHRIPGAHSAFLSVPDQVADSIVNTVQK